jgi:hypothetical protein
LLRAAAALEESEVPSVSFGDNAVAARKIFHSLSSRGWRRPSTCVHRGRPRPQGQG